MVRRAGSYAACLVLAAMSVQMAPPVAAAASPAEGAAALLTTATANQQPTRAAAPVLKPFKTPTEVPSLRTAYSNTFDNHNGTYTASVSSEPINYQPTAGATWTPIDLTLSAISGGNGRLRTAKTAVPVEVGAPRRCGGLRERRHKRRQDQLESGAGREGGYRRLKARGLRQSG